MATVQGVISAEALELTGLRRRPSRGYWTESLGRFRGSWLSMAAAIALILLLLITYSAPLIAQYVTGYDFARSNLRELYQAPSTRHWMGTDEFGRDYFTRIVYAGRVSITLGLTVAAIQLAIGVPLGLAAGYFGGLWDDIVTNVIAFLNCVPTLILLIILASWIPTSLLTLALIIGVFGWTGVARQVRGVVFSAKRRDYVEAARALGATNARLMFRHVLPNIMSIVCVVAGFDVAAGMFAESGLSYVGLGIRPPDPSWGNMLTNSFSYLNKGPHLILFPGLCIFLAILAIFLTFDGLRDALDPRLKN